LLGVLLPEIGPIGLDDVKEFGNDCDNSRKMGRARRSFQRLRNLRHRDRRLEPGRIHRRIVRQKDEVHALVLKQAQVPICVAWIGVEVFVRRELRGVDKDAGGETSVLASGAANERKVSFV
jgi:hypothetical protein